MICATCGRSGEGPCDCPPPQELQAPGGRSIKFATSLVVRLNPFKSKPKKKTFWDWIRKPGL